MSDIDFELKKRFADLRAEDEAHAPEFGGMREQVRLDAAPAAGSSRRRAAWIAPALLAAAATVILVWGAVRSRGPQVVREAWRPDSSMDVFRWTMPTDGLLESARRILQAPALSESVLDGAAAPIPGTPFKGD